ncbi:MAG: NYN domain-containing protein [Actinomycetota bacterium]|nr:NYN domain-containing protein [Actinomycetota bacterium]
MAKPEACTASADADAEPLLSGPLPEQVRVRVVALAADALAQVPAEQLPAPLRRVAQFAPVRRARLAANQIATALDADPDFRGRIARQVRIVVPDLAAALDAGAPPTAADPVEVAALAYLLRPPGWTDLIGGGPRPDPSVSPPPDHAATVQRVQRQLEQARRDARAARDRHREHLENLKKRNADLRRQLAETRARLEAAESAAAAARAAQDAAVAGTAGAEAEARRLRVRVSELEAATSASRRSARDERATATVRTRLLLDTLLESVQGLRRELALPAVAGLPADAVAEASKPSDPTAGRAGPTEATGLARSTDDPALLAELLALPRVHLIVDGYNVTKTAWPTTPLAEQRTRLSTSLAAVVARHGMEATVVFDGADLAVAPTVSPPRGVRVLFSPSGAIADDVIRDLVAAEPPGRPVVVVSSDREVAEAVARAGARAVQALALVRMLTGG